MFRRRTGVRDAIIPDISVKMLELCLSNDENGIFMPSTQRKSKQLEYRSDWALQEIISERIKKEQAKNVIPLVLRKRELYNKINNKNLEKETEKTKKIEELISRGKTPIILRKLLLYNQSRAG